MTTPHQIQPRSTSVLECRTWNRERNISLRPQRPALTDILKHHPGSGVLVQSFKRVFKPIPEQVRLARRMVWNEHRLENRSALRFTCRIFNPGERIFLDESIEGEATLAPQFDELRNENIGDAVTFDDTTDRATEQKPIHIKSHFRAERRHANYPAGTR